MLTNARIKELSNYSKELDKKKEKINTSFLPFTEKYRPKKIEDLILPDIIRSKLNNIIANKIVPNIVIIGPSGVGKTTLILALAKETSNKDNDSIISLNSIDNRGLEIINNTIIYFCKKKLVDKDNNIIPKLILMDEADNITKKAQNIISNLIEEHSQTTRFIFTCNESNKLIESIQSRCLMIYLPLIPQVQIVEYLKKICKIENISYDEEALEMIAINCKLDLRACINVLESIYNGFDYISCENIVKLSFQPNPKKILYVIQECASREINKAIILINELKHDGYCTSDILLAMIEILKQVSIDEDIRIKYIDIISQYYNKVIDGLDTNLQLYGCLSKMILVN